MRVDDAMLTVSKRYIPDAGDGPIEFSYDFTFWAFDRRLSPKKKDREITKLVREVAESIRLNWRRHLKNRHRYVRGGAAPENN